MMYGFLGLVSDFYQMILGVLHSWQFATHSLYNADPWDCSKQQFKGCKAGGGIGPGIVNKLYHWQ